MVNWVVFKVKHVSNDFLQVYVDEFSGRLLQINPSNLTIWSKHGQSYIENQLWIHRQIWPKYTHHSPQRFTHFNVSQKKMQTVYIYIYKYIMKNPKNICSFLDANSTNICVLGHTSSSMLFKPQTNSSNKLTGNGWTTHSQFRQDVTTCSKGSIFESSTPWSSGHEKTEQIVP